MDKNLFETIDPIVNEIADQLTTLIEGDTLSELKQKLADLSRELGVYSVTLEMNLQLCNPDDGQTLPLLQTGLASSDGAMPYQMWKKSPGRRNWHFDFLELVNFKSTRSLVPQRGHRVLLEATFSRRHQRVQLL